MNARPPTDAPRFTVAWADDAADVRAAQRLRHDVFALEMGARLNTPLPGHDVDLFDDFCEHLLVRDAATGQVVGTYRVLTPAQARRVGSTYSDTEFDLTRLRGLRERMVELGRSCVHPDHRHGGVILALWGALAEFMVRNQLDTMIGCASISLADGGHNAAAIFNGLGAHMSPPEYRVFPKLRLPLEQSCHEGMLLPTGQRAVRLRSCPESLLRPLRWFFEECPRHIKAHLALYNYVLVRLDRARRTGNPEWRPETALPAPEEPVFFRPPKLTVRNYAR